MSEPTQQQIDALAKDYAARWHGEHWTALNEDERAEWRIEAHRWLKCWFAVADTRARKDDQNLLSLL